MFVVHDTVTTLHWALKYDPARLLNHPCPLSRSCKQCLVFVVCWGPHAGPTSGVGCVAVGTWRGVPIRPFGVSGPLFTSFGAVSGNLGRPPCGWNPNRR